jgi:hypothetical protein
MDQTQEEIKLFNEHKDMFLKTIDDDDIIITNLRIDRSNGNILFIVKYVIDNSFGYLDKNKIVFN